MALIKCSKCGKEVSDKAKSCIHCGSSLEKKEKEHCPECGKILKDNKCNNCGYQHNPKMEDVDNKENQNTNNSNVNTTNNSAGTFMGIIGFIVLSIIIYSVINSFSGTSNIESNKGPEAYKNTTWKTTDGYALEIGTNSCKVTFNEKVLKNKCEFTTNSNGSGVGKITICNEYGLNCDDFEISKENYLYDQIYVYNYTWYKQ